jgi:hypothetical protein
MRKTKLVYTVSDAARATGRLSNRKLIRKLIARFKIETHRVGQCVLMDQENYDRLLRAVRDWDNRLTLSQSRSSA